MDATHIRTAINCRHKSEVGKKKKIQWNKKHLKLFNQCSAVNIGGSLNNVNIRQCNAMPGVCVDDNLTILTTLDTFNTFNNFDIF